MAKYSSSIGSLLLFLVVFFTLSLWGSNMCGAAEDKVGEECSKYFEKVVTCLGFATGKADTPTKECCNSVKDIKDSDPTCLCYVMQQTHHGSDQVKKMGIQEDRLLHLPSACKLTNASASNCPKLLNIPPSSPDFAYFTNSSASSTTTAPISTASGKSTPLAKDSSDGSKLGPNFSVLPLALAMAIFVSVLPVGFMSTF